MKMKTFERKLRALSPLIPSILHLSYPQRILVTITESLIAAPAEFLFPVDSSVKSEKPFHLEDET